MAVSGVSTPYRTLGGVQDVVSGYTGGHTIHPNYVSVGSASTGHDEAVAVTFDPVVIPDDITLDVFLSLHDPRQLNRRGADVGTPYRPAHLYTDFNRSRCSRLPSSALSNTGMRVW